MAAFNEFIQQLKENINLADLIGSYVPLKKHGRYYMASCPFHGPERTPSFAVSPDKGFYYCFGCHESGDAITFVERWIISPSWKQCAAWPIMLIWTCRSGRNRRRKKGGPPWPASSSR